MCVLPEMKDTYICAYTISKKLRVHGPGFSLLIRSAVWTMGLRRNCDHNIISVNEAVVTGGV